MLPLVHMLSSSDSSHVSRKLGKLLNAILQRGGDLNVLVYMVMCVSVTGMLFSVGVCVCVCV